MAQIGNFSELTAHMKATGLRKRVVAVCPNDPETTQAILRALEEGFADFILIGDTTILSQNKQLDEFSGRVEVIDMKDPDEAARHAVELVRQGRADVIMKGIINTDNLLRAILNKETGLLPKGRLLTHITAAEIPDFDRLLLFADVAVIPYPTFEQRIQMLHYYIDICHKLEISQPKVALIHFTEKVNPKFPNSTDYQKIIELANNGEFGNAIIGGPMDVKTACDKHSAQVKGIKSDVCGEADLLMFPNIESANTFYKTLSYFGHAELAGILVGPSAPVVLPSRSDSATTKYYSLALAVLTSACD